MATCTVCGNAIEAAALETTMRKDVLTDPDAAAARALSSRTRERGAPAEFEVALQAEFDEMSPRPDRRTPAGARQGRRRRVGASARFGRRVAGPLARARAAKRQGGLRMHQPTAEKALRQLDVLVGEWTLEAKWATGEPWPGAGRVTFEWHSSRAHLVQRGTVDHPDAPDNISIIGCDAANGTYIQLYSDERGVCRVYQMSINDDEWRLWRDGAPFSQRFTARFSEDASTITGGWEMAEGGADYRPDFDVVLRRARPTRR